MPPKSGWTAEADRHLLLAMAMAGGNSQKPNPKWEQVEAIMKSKWGYNFTSSALYQHFNKRIWKEIMEGAVNSPGASPASTPASTAKKRPAPRSATKKKTFKEDSDSDSSDQVSVAETPSKKAKTTIAKKPRGRPPKFAQLVSIEDEDMDSVEVKIPKEESDEDDRDGLKRARSHTLDEGF